MGHIGMRYSPPSREIIADSVETVVSAHWFDGMVCIPNCDKITPGMLMAAMRINIPTIFVSGGRWRQEEQVTGAKSPFPQYSKGRRLQAGKINENELQELEQFDAQRAVLLWNVYSKLNELSVRSTWTSFAG